MPIKSNITDKQTGNSAAIRYCDSIEKNALVVTDVPCINYENTIRFFSNVDEGFDLNKDGSAGGTPLNIHNGLDNVYWTGTNIVDTVNFQDGGRAYEGSYSIDFSTWANAGDLCQIAKPSGTQDLTNYSSLTMWLNINNNWDGDSVSVFGWDTTTGTQVGTKALLENYIDTGQVDVWQNIVIPLGDMNLTGKTIDAIRFQYEGRDGIAVNFYIDLIQFQETGSAIEYTIEPDNETWLYVDEINFHVAYEADSTLTDAGLPYLPYDKFGGLTLSAGILYQRTQNGEVKFNTILRNLSDIMQIAGTTIAGAGSDGTNTWVTYRVTNFAPFVLKPETLDKIAIRIQDDLSSLLRFRVSVGARILDKKDIGAVKVDG
jgi:hypothetical protein